MTVQIYRGRGLKNWRVRVVSDNGRILTISEGFFSKSNARRHARKVFPGLTIREVSK